MTWDRKAHDCAENNIISLGASGRVVGAETAVCVTWLYGVPESACTSKTNDTYCIILSWLFDRLTGMLRNICFTLPLSY